MGYLNNAVVTVDAIFASLFKALANSFSVSRLAGAAATQLFIDVVT